MRVRTSLRSAAIAALLLTTGCNVSQHRHQFALAAGHDQQLLEVWMRPADSGPGSLWLDTLFFPLDFVASTWTCAQASWRDDVDITWGPLGWLATLLPACSANWYGDPRKSPLPIKPFAPESAPVLVAVRPEDLLALRTAPDGHSRRQAFVDAVQRGLPRGNPATRFVLDQRLWREVLAPAVVSVELKGN